MTARGFTLLEMLVALAILSLAALALVRLDAFAVRSTGAVDGAALARIVAANAATDILSASTAPSPGRQSTDVTNGGRRWTIMTEAVPAAGGGLLRIDIRVRGDDGRAALTIITAAGP